ncbi:sulfatase family protein [Gaetbulibacter saemankumensis]|uniref:sulfatase family protein n=1 Tax=Gaetbulibacter saemankumensis TaxID=311208 RepID=UPI00146D57D8|nr:sulfatase [Gaetbulibacter saemankumensis]
MIRIYGALILVFVFSCRSEAKLENSSSAIDYSKLELPDKPNILWIVAEDLSPYIPTYGDSTVVTPNISRLAEEGIVYTNFYSPSGVCAPSRAAIATGTYPTRIGAQHMRTGPWFRFSTTDRALENYAKHGRLAYEALPETNVHMLSTYLRKHGYYCSNNPKEDYQFRCEIAAWDESSFQAHYKNRKPGQPFYAIFNLDNTHESMIWRKAKDSLLVDENLNVPVPPYLPNTPIALQDIRRNYSNIIEMDNRVGEILKELEQTGELENTIIFWYTDHGGPLPRQKRTVYQSGIHVPMIVRFPNKQFAGQIDDQLLSFIDLKPTVMSLLGIELPEKVDGKAWLGKHANADERQYLFAAADRFDNETDKIRAVFNKNFKLIKYYNLNQAYYLPVKYRETMPIMRELLRLRDKDSLNDIQKQWFRKTKDSIEFFDLVNDPDEIHNLANKPEYQEQIQTMHAELDQWIKDTNDKGKLLEKDYLETIWPDGNQPKTEDPKVQVVNEKIQLMSLIKGANIGYQWADSEETLTNNWEIYVEPIKIQTGKILFVMAHKIGYKTSDIIEKTF